MDLKSNKILIILHVLLPHVTMVTVVYQIMLTQMILHIISAPER